MTAKETRTTDIIKAESVLGGLRKKPVNTAEKQAGRNPNRKEYNG